MTAETLYFVYDGECPLCCMGARGLKIKQAVGQLELVDARDSSNHPIVQEINHAGLNLDDGMVLKYNGKLYHGDDALHLMALVGSGQGWFNKINAALFKHKWLAKFSYPFMRGGRNILLKIKGVDKINNLKTSGEVLKNKHYQSHIFENVLKQDWQQLPPVLQQHYQLRAYSNDTVVVKGHLNIQVSKIVGFMARLTKSLVPYSGENIPVTVEFRAEPDSNAIQLNRTLQYPDKPPIEFNSRMVPLHNNVLVEVIRFGIGWKLAYVWQHNKLVLQHRGYLWQVGPKNTKFNIPLPLPLSLVLGKGHAEEAALSATTFSMFTHARHPIFGKTLAYDGVFKLCPANPK